MASLPAKKLPWRPWYVHVTYILGYTTFWSTFQTQVHSWYLLRSNVELEKLVEHKNLQSMHIIVNIFDNVSLYGKHQSNLVIRHLIHIRLQIFFHQYQFAAITLSSSSQYSDSISSINLFLLMPTTKKQGKKWYLQKAAGSLKKVLKLYNYQLFSQMTLSALMK